LFEVKIKDFDELPPVDKEVRGGELTCNSKRKPKPQ